MLKASIIIPTIRKENIPNLLREIDLKAGIPSNEYEVIVKYDDLKIGCPKMVKILTTESNAPNVMFLGDDTIPRENFLRNALHYMSQFPAEWGLVTLNDFDRQPHVPTHWLASKKLLPLLDGEFFHTGYRHSYCDNELGERCQALGRYIFGESAQIDHMHPCHGKGDFDEHYERVYNDENFRHDQMLFLQRKIDRGSRTIAVCLPTTNEKDLNEFWFSFTRMEKPFGNEITWKLLTPKIRSGDEDRPQNIAAIRNELCKQALHWRINATDIVMFDTDQIFLDRETLKKLVIANRPFIGTRIHRRYPPFEPLLRELQPNGHYLPISEKKMYSGKLEKIDACGTGAFLVQTPALLSVPMPWFEFSERPPDKDGVCSPVGEDIYFCEKLRDAGFDLYADTSIEILHSSRVGIDRTYHEVFMKIQAAMIKEIQEAKEKEKREKEIKKEK